MMITAPPKAEQLCSHHHETEVLPPTPPVLEVPNSHVIKDSCIPDRPLKRRRSLPITPPATFEDPETATILDRAVAVLTTEATALSFVSQLYQTCPVTRVAFTNAVAAIVNAQEMRGKLIICGVGKSAYVGMKIVATMKSLGIACSFLHAGEAMHGDLGDVREGDVVLFVSFSGRTVELTSVVKHFPPNLTIIALTAHHDASLCPLLQQCHQTNILLPAPIHESETSTFGVAAPTTSTTVAMAVGDMLALTAADILHQGEPSKVFLRNHPGGSIGAAIKVTP